MDPDFWHAKWQKNEIAFHLDAVNPLLVEFFGQLELPRGSRIFVPLCGKTRDIHWLLAAGYRVVGVELSELAVRQLFAELGSPALIAREGEFERYAAEGIDILVGDIFALDRRVLGPVDAIYDRAALVALPAATRARYASLVTSVSGLATLLLISYEYDERIHAGPPFSVSDDEVRRLFDPCYRLSCIASRDVPGGLKGKYPAREHVWIARAP